MPRFRKKPVEIEAIQWDGNNWKQIKEFAGETFKGIRNRENILFIRTLEGTMGANPGDWIIKGVKGEFYLCKNEIFKMTYDEIPNDEIHFEPDMNEVHSNS